MTAISNRATKVAAVAAVSLASALLVPWADARPGGPAPEAEPAGTHLALAWGTGEEPRYVPVAPSRAVPETRSVGERLELRWGTGQEPRLVPVGAER